MGNQNGEKQFMVRGILAHTRKNPPEPMKAGENLKLWGGPASLGNLAEITSRADRLEVAKFLCFHYSQIVEYVIAGAAIYESLLFSGKDPISAEAGAWLIYEFNRTKKIQKAWKWDINQIRQRTTELAKLHPEAVTQFQKT